MLTTEDLNQIKSIIDTSIHASVKQIVKDEIGNFSITSLPLIVRQIVNEELTKQNEYLDTKFEMLAKQLREYTNILYDDHEARIRKLESTSFIIRDK